jgi:hypothetical protein
MNKQTESPFLFCEREGELKKGKERQSGGKDRETDTEERERVVRKVR